MSISFNCNYCGRKIESPQSAAGKWGKCPGCHKKVQVPQSKTADDEELKLAPIDQSELTKQKQLIAETHQLTQKILEQRGAPEPAAGPVGITVPADNSEKLTTNIIMYLRHLADGELGEAEKLEASIASGGGKAKKILKNIATKEPPEPELADISRKVLSGLIKQLQARIR